MLIIYTLFMPFQIGLFILFGISLLTNSNIVESEFVLSAICLTIPAIVGIIFFRKEIIESFAYFKEKTILKIVSVPLVVLFMVSVEQAVMRFLALGQPANQEEVLKQAAETPLILTLLVSGILAPLLEELVFRHVLLNRLSNYIGTAIASIISILILHSFIRTNFRIMLFIYLARLYLLRLILFLTDPLHMLWRYIC